MAVRFVCAFAAGFVVQMFGAPPWASIIAFCVVFMGNGWE